MAITIKENSMTLPLVSTNTTMYTTSSDNYCSPKKGSISNDEHIYKRRCEIPSSPIALKPLIGEAEYERMKFKNTRTPVKVSRMKNRNQYYRRIHNIKQPGRTNCTQRLF